MIPYDNRSNEKATNIISAILGKIISYNIDLYLLLALTLSLLLYAGLSNHCKSILG
jgi:hypothetical protein